MAASAQGIRAGRAYVEVGADKTPLERGLRTAERRVRAFGQSVEAIGQKFLGIGAAMAAPFVAAGSQFASFEQEMARVLALTNASQDEFKALNSVARRLGATTVFTATQAAQAMSAFALAGYDMETILRAVGPTLQLAAAGQLEIAQAADIATKVLSGMGTSVDEFGNTVDVMAKAMTTANTDLLMLGDAFKYVGPIAKVAGISLEEITAAIQLLSNAGIQGEMAGTTLRGIIVSLVSPSGKAIAKMAELGVSVKDAQGNFRSLTAILADIEKGLAGLGTAGKLEAISAIFPDRQAAGAAALAAQGAERLAGATKALGDSTGTAARIAGVQLDTLYGSFKIVLSALQDVAIEIGASVSPLFRAWGEDVVAVLGGLSRFVKENRELVALAAKVSVGLIASGAALVALGLAAKVAAAGMAALAAITAFALSPLGSVVVGLGVATTALVVFTETGQEAFLGIKTTATDAFDGIKAAMLKGDIALAGKVLMLSVSVEVQKGLNFLMGLWNDWGLALKTVWSDLGFSIVAALEIALGRVNELIANNLAAVAAAFRAIGSVVGDAFGVDLAASIDRAMAKAGLDPAGLAGRRQRLDARLKTLEAGRQAKNEERANAARDSDLAGQAKLAKLQDDLAKALAEAKKAVGPDATKKDAGGKKPLLPPSLDPGVLDANLQQSNRSVDVAGSFSAAALRGLGAGGSTADRTARATEKTAEGIAKLNDRARQGRLVFDA